MKDDDWSATVMGLTGADLRRLADLLEKGGIQPAPTMDDIHVTDRH